MDKIASNTYKRTWALKNIEKVRTSQRNWYRRNREQANALTRAWQKRHWRHFLDTQNIYRKHRYRIDPQYVKHTSQKNRESYRKHRAKRLIYNAKRVGTLPYRAVTLLNCAIRRGDITRPTVCDACKRKCVPDGHHHRGYDHPLKVIWLCKFCHRAIHRPHPCSPATPMPRSLNS